MDGQLIFVFVSVTFEKKQKQTGTMHNIAGRTRPSFSSYFKSRYFILWRQYVTPAKPF